MQALSGGEPIDRLFVSTRKGLFRLVRDGAWWSIERVSFLGDAVSLVALRRARRLALRGARARALRREAPALARPRRDVGGARRARLPQAARAARSRRCRTASRGHGAWSRSGRSRRAARPGELWCGTIGGGLFRSRDAGALVELVRALWDHPKRKEWFGGGADLPGIHSICVDPRDPQRHALGVSCGGVWRARTAARRGTLSSERDVRRVHAPAAPRRRGHPGPASRRAVPRRARTASGRSTTTASSAPTTAGAAGLTIPNVRPVGVRLRRRGPPEGARTRRGSSRR